MMHNIGTMMRCLMKKDVRMLNVGDSSSSNTCITPGGLHRRLNIPAAEFVDGQQNYITLCIPRCFEMI